ncbi:copper amine oxidase N-terminal domain-containing protein [Paenibacillus senegalimassiliensis]|uniref:copper amine oxidase N-terminal domain-containing protein n=1 Tax=Paenibacillus senegalimassiliensis TaxID=1737426 RepID=UPI00073EA5C6|nr:copper amine oxidase N-terminal domain-containing protein [Paenibacillus senegalimassiliensis]
MRKQSLIAFFILLATGIFWSSAASADNSSVTLNINGEKLTDEKALIINQTTMVPIRTISQLPFFTVNWDNSTKVVSVQDTLTGQVLKLTVGSKEALKGTEKITANETPQIVDGSVYVPLRFIAESLDTLTFWDATTRTAVVYQVPANQDTESSDLAVARQAVLELPRISLNAHLGSTMDVRNTLYYFPYGHAKSFFIQEGNYIRYYEVRDDAAWQVWEGEVTSKPSGEPDVIKNLVPAVSKEWGERPSYAGDYAYYSHGWMAGTLHYGILTESGEYNELDNVNNVHDKIKVYLIADEERVD